MVLLCAKGVVMATRECTRLASGSSVGGGGTTRQMSVKGEKRGCDSSER